MIVAALVFLHGAIHLSFLAPRPPATAGGPPWPFTLERSWVLSRVDAASQSTRPLGLALTAATVVALTCGAMSLAGFLPWALWPPVVAIGAGTSLALLVLFFHPWLVLGIVIDLGLLAAVFLAHGSGSILR